MKLTILAVLALLSISTARGNLQSDLNDFKDFIPKTKLVAIVAKHMIFDKEFRNFKNFLSSNEIHPIWDQIIINEKFHNVVEYARKSGLDIVKILNKIAADLNSKKYESVVVPDSANLIQSRTVKSFIEDVIGAFPKSKISDLMKQKLQTSPEFRQFVETLSSNEFHQLVNEMKSDPKLAEPFGVLASKGLKIEQVINVGFDILSWAH